MNKDITWTIDGVKYTIRNVPYEKHDADGEEFIDLDVAIKLEIIRELMNEDKIPQDVDYSLAEGIEF